MCNDLEYHLDQVCSFVFPVFVDCQNQGRVVGSDVHKHSALKIRLSALSHIKGCLSEEARDFIKQGLVMTCVFVYVFKVRKFFDSTLVDKARDAN